jgi:dCMP deaminase
VESFAEERKAKWDLRYLHLAKYISSWSKDPTTKVGAVIVRKDNTICSTGFNGFPKGTDDHPYLYRNRKQKLLRTVHAEMNALLFSRDTSLEDYILYTYPFEPCSNCAAAIIQSGITRIVTIPPSKELEERWNESLFEARSMFEQSGIVIDYVDDLEELCN